MSKQLLYYQIRRVALIKSENEAVMTRLRQVKSYREENGGSLYLYHLTRWMRPGNFRRRIARMNLGLAKAICFALYYDAYIEEEKARSSEVKTLPELRSKAYQTLSESIEEEISQKKRANVPRCSWVQEI